MPEVGCLSNLDVGRGRRSRPLSLLFLHFFLLSPFLIGCSDTEADESDPALDYIHTSRSLLLDSGTPGERLLRGDTLHDFLDDFRRDTFRPGPRTVRIESDCHPGVLTIGRNRYPVALCRLVERPRRQVISVDLDTGVVRLINVGKQDR